jgi:hypothetical protein
MTLPPLDQDHLTDYQRAKEDENHGQVHPFVAFVDVVHFHVLVPYKAKQIIDQLSFSSTQCLWIIKHDFATHGDAFGQRQSIVSQTKT